MFRAPLLAGVLSTVALGAIGCQENYSPVVGEDPPKIVVQDQGDKIDRANIENACRRLGYKTAKVQPFADDPELGALVTCKR